MTQRERSTPRAVARAGVLLVCAALLSTPGGAVLADTPEPGGVVRVDADGLDVSGLHGIGVQDIAPGYRELWSVRVVNERTESVRVEVRVDDLVNDDNGCGSAESREDTTCGAGEGELGAHLELSLGTPGDEGAFSAVLDDAVEGSGPVVTVPGGGGEAQVLLGFRLPPATGNVVQSDSVGFTLTWRTEAVPGAGGRPVEGGAQVRSAAAGTGDGAGLPVTGAALLAFVGLAVTLLAGGALMVLGLMRGGRRGRRGRSSTGVVNR